ncbi:MAG TPA: ATP-binding protein [Myxococcaceae bacterium]|nr:ATP-binding protein [Myxococcaceae bacterium]
MAGIHKALEAIIEDDLQALLTDGVPEGRQIEYKRQLPGNSDDEKREFLSDVSSFANAAGGDLVYGVGEAGGVPTSIDGVSSADPDAEILRLESIIRMGLEPRIPGIHIRAVSLANGNLVFVVRVPQSWALPHMVVFKNLSRFFSRTSAGKYQLDVAELRAHFLGSAEAAERIRRFRDERLARIVAGEGAFPMSSPSLVVLHLVPLRLSGPGKQLDMRLLGRQTLSLQPLYSSGWDDRYNLDGYATWGSSLFYVGSGRNVSLPAIR